MKVKKVKDILYKLLANIHMWYLLIIKKQNDERAISIYIRWTEMQMSALYIFVAVIPVILTLAVSLENQFLPFLILVFGGNLVLTLIMLNRERGFYWAWKEKKDEEELKIREVAEQKRRAQEELERIKAQANAESMRRFFEQQQRIRQQSESSNSELSIHLRNLGLATDCRDMTLIKKAYRNLMKQHHPDINKSTHSAEITKTIVTSYKFLEKKLSR